jgi:hypothetical protein
MGTIFSNRYADAFAKTLVIFGTIHIIVLISIAIRGDIDALNAFRILDLHVFVPALRDGLVNLVVSACVVLSVYSLVLLRLTKRKQNQ